MGDLFAGLESMGLGGLSGVRIYEDEKQPDAKGSPEAARHIVTEEDFLFDKKMQCPVCDKEFKSRTVKTGKPRLIGSDSDLRPKYSGIDSIKYDAIVCPNCGYAALSRFFGYMTSAQAKLIKENISAKFRPTPETGAVYSYDEAIKRHKLVLLNTIVKKAHASEKAYTCLKIAWLYRGKRENLDMSAPNAAAIKKECEKNEQDMLSNAFDGFITGRAKEDFPICGMDEPTFDYLLADLAAKLGKYEISGKFATEVILSRTANSKLKERARDLRDMVKVKIK